MWQRVIASDYSGLSLYDISQKYNYEDISLEEAEKLYQNYELFWEDFSDYIQYMTKSIPIMSKTEGTVFPLRSALSTYPILANGATTIHSL